jgi:hypothetical protein
MSALKYHGATRPAVLANIGKTVNYQNDVVAAFAPPKAV